MAFACSPSSRSSWGGCSDINQPAEKDVSFGLQSIPRFANPHDPTKVRSVANATKGSSPSAMPDYATCVVSTLLPTDSTYNYRYNTYKIKLPGHAHADPSNFIWKDYVFGSEQAPSRATHIKGYGGITRMARCRIPQSSQLERWLQDKFRRFGRGSWVNVRRQVKPRPGTIKAMHTGAGGQWICNDYLIITRGCVEMYNRDGDFLGKSCTYDITCVSYTYEAPPQQEGPGGSGGPVSGPSDNPCAPCSQQSSPGYSPCEDQPGSPTGCTIGGGGSTPLPPTDPCNFANPPDYCSDTIDLKNDFQTQPIDTTNLVCDGSYSGTANEKETKKAWCASSVPTDGRLQKTNNALDKIAQRGSACDEIAQKGRELLQQHGLRYYPDGTIQNGAKGGPSFGALLSTRWLSYYNNPGTMIDEADGTIVKINLQFALAHEIEHVLNRDHITLPNGKESKLLTPHAIQCSGL